MAKYKHGRYPMTVTCKCDKCTAARSNQSRRNGGNWNGVVGGSDADGNPVTVSFGRGSRSGETLIADGDQSEGNFFDSANHDHFGSGNGPNDNGTRRGKYTGRGS